MCTRFILPLAVLLFVSSAIAHAQELGGIMSNQPDKVLNNKPFTMLLVFDEKATQDRVANWVYAACKSPKSQEFQQLMASCDFRAVSIDSPHVEKLQYHLSKHQKLPILLFAESPGVNTAEGAAWWSAAAEEIPTSEAALAAEINRWIQATLKVATQRAQPKQAFNQLPNQEYQPQYPPYYVPIPQTTVGREKKPWVSPQIDVNVPDTITTSVEAGLRKDTLRGLIAGGFLVIATALIGAYARIYAARIQAAAIIARQQQPPVQAS